MRNLGLLNRFTSTQTGRKVFTSASCALLFALAGCSTHSTDQSKMILPCKVVRLKGQARWKLTPGESWQPLKNGQKVTPSTVIETAADSTVDLSIGKIARHLRSPNETAALSAPEEKPEESLIFAPPPNWRAFAFSARLPLSDAVRIWDNSRLLVRDLEGVAVHHRSRRIEEVQLQLEAGHIRFSVSHLAEGVTYRISIPGSFITVEPGFYDINVDGIVKVEVGSARVVSCDGTRMQKVIGEQMYDTRTGILSNIPRIDRTGCPPLISAGGNRQIPCSIRKGL